MIKASSYKEVILPADQFFYKYIYFKQKEKENMGLRCSTKIWSGRWDETEYCYFEVWYRTRNILQRCRDKFSIEVEYFPTRLENNSFLLRTYKTRAEEFQEFLWNLFIPEIEQEIEEKFSKILDENVTEKKIDLSNLRTKILKVVMEE